MLKFASVYYPPTCFEATCTRHPSCTAINVHATSGCDVPRGRRSCGDMFIGLIGHYRPSNGVFMAVSKMQEFLTPSKNRRSPGCGLRACPRPVPTPSKFLPMYRGPNWTVWARFLVTSWGFKGRMMLNVCLIRRLLQWESEIGNMLATNSPCISMPFSTLVHDFPPGYYLLNNLKAAVPTTAPKAAMAKKKPSTKTGAFPHDECFWNNTQPLGRFIGL